MEETTNAPDNVSDRKAHHVYVPEFVYGSMDGLVTTFAIVTGAVGAGLSPVIILIVGFANVFADGFSMGSSSYLSAKSEESLQGAHATKTPIAQAVVTFVSFIVVGLVPILPFVFAVFVPAYVLEATYVSVGATMIAFGAVGYVSGVIEKNNRWIATIRNMVIGGIAALISFVIGAVLATTFGI